MPFSHFQRFAVKSLACLALFAGLLAIWDPDPTLAVSPPAQKTARPDYEGLGHGGRGRSLAPPIHHKVSRTSGHVGALNLPDWSPPGASSATVRGGATKGDARVLHAADSEESLLRPQDHDNATARGLERPLSQRVAPSLLPAHVVKPDLQQLRAGFAAEMENTGLDVLDDVEEAPMSDVVNRISFAAFSPDFGPGYSGQFFQRRDILVVSTTDGAISIATSDVIVARDGDQLSVRFVRRFDSGVDRIAGGPTGLGGMVIEHLAVATIDDFDTALEMIAHANNPDEAADLLSTTSLLVVGDIAQQVRVTNGLGDSLTFEQGEMTVPAAMRLLGGSCTPFWDCVWDCVAADGFDPSATLVLCLVDAVFACLPYWAIPQVGAVCTASYFLICAGLSIAVEELLDLVFCAWDCWFVETSILVEITDLYPNPVEPNAPVFIEGEAQYDNCAEVENATAQIYLRNWSGTAPVVNGHFSRIIYAPSSVDDYTVTVIVVDGQHQGSDTAVLEVEEENTDPPGCGFDLVDALVIYDYDESTSEWWSKNCFRTTDEFVNGLIHVNDLSCPVTLKWRFFYPDGSQYGQDLVWDFSDPVPPPNWYWWTWGFLIDGNAMSYTLGRYHVKMYIDSGQGFQLVGNRPYVVGWEFAEGVLCKNVNSGYPYDPEDITTIFYQSDPKMYTWTKVETVAQNTLLRCRFYEPNGSLYYEVNGDTAPGYDIGDPGGPHDCGEWYKSWASISISGATAAQRCGPWTAHIEYRNPTSGDWETLYEEGFQILEAPNVAPTVSANASPANPVEDESITLSVSVDDNTYVKRVELYWFDGAWRQETLVDDLFEVSFDGSHVIGSYAAGQEIEFYAVAVDTSGNAGVTDTQTTIVQPLCGNGAIDPGENCLNCPADVECPSGTTCVNGVCEPICLADVSGDDLVGAADLAIILGNWGPVPPNDPIADLNDDGVVDSEDLAFVLGNWGNCP